MNKLEGYCEACKHARFAHNGQAHEKPTGCDLCMCQEYQEAK